MTFEQALIAAVIAMAGTVGVLFRLLQKDAERTKQRLKASEEINVEQAHRISELEHKLAVLFSLVVHKTGEDPAAVRAQMDALIEDQ